MRKKVLAALLVAAVAGTTVMSGMTAFGSREQKEPRLKAVILPLQKQQIRRTSIRFMLWIRQALI